jgi:hypothetical protein
MITHFVGPLHGKLHSLGQSSAAGFRASFTSVRMAAISSWYSLVRRSKVRRSFVQTRI